MPFVDLRSFAAGKKGTVLLRGLPFMTSALRGEGAFKSRHSKQVSKGGCVNLRTRGEGVRKSGNFADVINGSPLSTSLAWPAVAGCRRGKKFSLN